MSEARPTSIPLATMFAIVASVFSAGGSCTAMVGTGVVTVRVFTQTESKVEDLDKRVSKVETLAVTTADHFNGPARAEHQKLVGRVDLIDAEVKTKASDEAMRGLASEMRQQFGHVIEILNEVRGHRKGQP